MTSKSKSHSTVKFREGYDSDCSFEPSHQPLNTREEKYLLRDRQHMTSVKTDMDRSGEDEQAPLEAKKKWVPQKKASTSASFPDHASYMNPLPTDPLQNLMTMMMEQQEQTRQAERVDRLAERREQREAEERRWQAEEKCREMEDERREQQRADNATASMETAKRVDQLGRDRMENAKEQAEARREEEVQTRKVEARLRTIRKMGPTDELDAYLAMVEQTLKQCQVEETEWIGYITSGLSGQFLTLAQNIRGGGEDEEKYVSFKARLLDVAGLTARSAGDLLFRLGPNDTKGKTAVEVFQLVWKNVLHLFLDIEYKDDFYMATALQVLRRMLPKEGVVQTGLHPPAQLELLLHSKQISTLSPSSLNSINSLLESSFELLTPSPLPLYYCIICIHHIVHPPITFTHICILFYAHPAYICSPFFIFASDSSLPVPCPSVACCCSLVSQVHYSLYMFKSFFFEEGSSLYHCAQ